MTALTDRVIVLTGACGGIGHGVAKVLLDQGARIVLTDLPGKGLHAVAGDLQAPAGRVLAVGADVTKPTDAAAVVDAAVERFGALHGLVNTAGVVMLNTAWDATAEEWERHLQVNVTGTFVFCQAVGERLRKGDGGAIVNVASNCAKAGYENMAAYNASKAAVVGLTRSLAMEWWRDGINVNAVCPGGVDTPMLSQVAEWLAPRTGQPATTLLEGMGLEQLGGRKVTPQEVGRVIAFLLSDDARIIRGQSISIDAGETPY